MNALKRNEKTKCIKHEQLYEPLPLKKWAREILEMENSLCYNSVVLVPGLWLKLAYHLQGQLNTLKPYSSHFIHFSLWHHSPFTPTNANLISYTFMHLHKSCMHTPCRNDIKVKTTKLFFYALCVWHVQSCGCKCVELYSKRLLGFIKGYVCLLEALGVSHQPIQTTVPFEPINPKPSEGSSLKYTQTMQHAHAPTPRWLRLHPHAPLLPVRLPGGNHNHTHRR